MLRWGLVPPWAEDQKIGNRLINARAETAAGKPSFRAAFKRRRCLVPADGFYEWQKVGRAKQPYYIRLKDGAPFAFAGLWEHWQGADGEIIESCTLLTTEANDLMRPIHERMPVMLKPEDFGRWLDRDAPAGKALAALLCPYPAEAMTAYPVSAHVNNPRNDGPACVAPAA
jgi:putative SOS response-associated peptidase YedK